MKQINQPTPAKAQASKTITLHKGGSAEKTVALESIIIPDLWHIAQGESEPERKRAILETWHLAHALLDSWRDFYRK